MGAELILSRLSQVRQTGPSQWSACCPAHKDKSPSLRVKENPDGRILMHCFGGCAVDAVTQAIGIELDELFPTPQGRPRFEKRGVLSSTQALEMLDKEATIVALVAAKIVKDSTITKLDKTRLVKAASRIAYLRREVLA